MTFERIQILLGSWRARFLGGAMATTGKARLAASADVRSVAAASAKVGQQSDAVILNESRRLGPLVAGLLHDVGRNIHAGMTTQSIADALVSRSGSLGLLPAMLGFGRFPAAAAISLNEEVVHGLPSSRELVDTDLLKIEFGVVSGLAFASHSWTFPVGTPNREDALLLGSGPRALRAALDVVSPKNRLGDVGAAIQQTLEAEGLSVVRSFVGYGMGKSRIQEPQVCGYGSLGRGTRIRPGWILNVHVIAKHGSPEVLISENDWTAISADQRRAALFSCMAEVTSEGCNVLTPIPKAGPA